MLDRRSSWLYLEVLILAATCAVLAAPCSVQAETSAPEGGDAICGPRCVYQVLHWYKMKSPKLEELVRDMQGVDLGGGSTLQQINATLNENGVHTLACEISSPTLLKNWREPIVVHLKPSQPNTGHFVVTTPSTDGSLIQVFDTGETELAASDLMELASGNILLTSQRPIHMDAVAHHSSYRPNALTAVTLGVMGATLALSCLAAFRRLFPPAAKPV